MIPPPDGRSGRAISTNDRSTNRDPTMPDAPDTPTRPGPPPWSPAGSTPSTASPPPGQPQVVYAVAPEKRRGGFLAKLAGSAILTLLVLSILANLYMGLILASLFGTSETVLEEGETEARIVVLPISGGIDAAMAGFVRESLQGLEADVPTAVILRVDSGGGGVSPSDQIYHLIEEFRVKHPEVPVVASFGGVAASGGYYVAMPADYIVAEPTCITGSIGVIAPAFTIGGLLEKIGVNPETIVADSSPKKDVANDITRPFGPEDVAAFKTILNAAHERFVEVVVDGRTTTKGGVTPTAEEVRAMCDGRIFTAKEALDGKMIDEIGYLNNATAKAVELAGLPAGTRPRITAIERQTGLLENLIFGPPAPVVTSGLAELDPERVRTFLDDMTATQLMYRAPFR